MDSTLESKQQYVAQEILKKGHNQTDFLNFLKTKRTNGDNFDQWTADELTQVVDEFQKKNPSNELLQSQTFRGTTMMTTNFGDIEPQVQCIQADKTDLSDAKEMKITLSLYVIIILSFSPEKKKENIGFGKTFTVSFLMETKPSNHKVRRNFEDFFWLRDILRSFFPGLYIPPISKKPLEESTKNEKIEKKMKNYERFLNSIAQDDLLRSSKLFFDFLTTVQESEYKLKMKAYQTIAPPKTLSELQSRSGIIDLQTEVLETNEVWQKTTENITANMNLLKRLNVSFTSLLNEVKQVSTRLTELSTIYGEMSTLASNYQNKSNEDLSKNYDGMKGLMLDLSYFYKKQAMLFDLDLKQHIKYVIKEYSSFKELRDNFNNSKINYNKRKEKLQSKKEDLFKKKDLKKWDLKAEDTKIDSSNKELAFEKMLPTETYDLLELKKFTCYLGCTYESEFNRVGKHIEAQNISVLKEVFEKNKIVVKELSNTWDAPLAQSEVSPTATSSVLVSA